METKLIIHRYYAEMMVSSLDFCGVLYGVVEETGRGWLFTPDDYPECSGYVGLHEVTLLGKVEEE